MTYHLSHTGQPLTGTIELTGSKSISNRVLLIRALSGSTAPIHRLAAADDTRRMEQLLHSSDDILDAGPAGTTYRFLTAFLAARPGTQVLTGSARMLQRPIGILVDALRQLGANIEYMGQEGYPPLRIHAPGPDFGRQPQVTIRANTSSQYISALLMLGPTLPHGLELTLDGQIVSRPYIEMTLALMATFGVQHCWEDQTIHIAPQSYTFQAYTVEADWSAASYYYTMVALAEKADLQLNGLFANSVQGDAVQAGYMRQLGVQTTYTEHGIRLSKLPFDAEAVFDYNFLRCPDLAQSVAVLVAARGQKAHFSGLETLRIKETDRIAALQQELAKVQVAVTPFKASDTEGMEISGQAAFDTVPSFATYEDHRMAMAFAPLALLHPVCIEEPMVVGKSYPGFWEDLKTLGFVVNV